MESNAGFSDSGPSIHETVYGSWGPTGTLDATLDAAGEAPVIRMVNTIMIEALKTKASDIHFKAMEKTSRLRYRIDGELVDRPAPPKASWDKN